MVGRAGTNRTLAENAAANGELWRALTSALEAAGTKPAAAWKTWGSAACLLCVASPTRGANHLSFSFDRFNRVEGWREDGFCLAFPAAEHSREHRELGMARDAIVAIAIEFKQGAIFEVRHRRRRIGDRPTAAAAQPVVGQEELQRSVLLEI